MVLLLLCAGGLTVVTSFAQSVNQTQNKADQVLKSDGRVNPSTLAMELSIPLGGFPGRAGNGKPVTLEYSSKVWDSDIPSNWSYSNLHNAIWTDLKPRFAKEGIASVNGVVTRVTDGSHAGWTSSLGAPRIKYRWKDNYWNEPIGETSGYEGRLWREPIPLSGEQPPAIDSDVIYYIKRLDVIMPDGSTVGFRQDDNIYVSGSTGTGYGNFDWNGTYLSVDGSRLRLVIAGGQPTLYLPDGGRYIFGADDTATTYWDAHGNKTTYDLATRQWTDTLGRVLGDPLPVANNAPAPTAGTKSYTLPGFDDQSQTVEFVWAKLDTQQTTLGYPSPRSCSGPNFSTSIPAGSTALFTDDPGMKIRACGTSTAFDPVVLTEIHLPNGAAYKFHYNIYGEMDRIEYPTGGYERFEYAAVTPLAATKEVPYDQFNRGVKYRWVSADGTAASEVLWQYTVEVVNDGYPATDYYRVRTNAPDGTATEQYLTNESSEAQYPWGFGNIAVGRPYDVRSYAAGTGSLASRMMSRRLTKYTMTAHTITGTMTSGYQATRDLRPEKQISVVFEPNQTSALATMTETIYEVPGQNNAPTDPSYFAALNARQTKTYHYIALPVADAQNLTVDQIAALFTSANPATVTEMDYLYDADYLARNISGLPTETRLKDAAGNLKARTHIEYDEANYTLSSTGTMPTAAANSWIDLTSPGQLGATIGAKRGLPTTVRSYSDLAVNANLYIETHSFYDQYGNVRKMRDGRGNDTEMQYDAVNAFAYPTKTISAIPGGNGSTTAFRTTVAYDYNTGLPTASTDANNLETRMEYVDPLYRPTRMQQYFGGLPVGAATETVYGAGTSDATRYVKSRTQIDETKWKEGYSWYDGLGRATKSQSVDATSGDVFALTCYDAVGRAQKTSNPFRNVMSATCASTNLEWTTLAYDTAGRAWKTTTPDGAVVQTDYALATTGDTIGTAVTVTDQALKQRRSITNALGQLKRVDEPTEANGLGAVNAPNQATYYAYDPLNNLTTVNQGGQTRSFVYDSLSRLKWATNPELGTTATDGTITYDYDDNGNLTLKTDPRGVQTSYDYDALNRVTARSYTAPGGLANYQAAPNVTYAYDDLPHAKGKLTKVSSAASTTEYTAFDVLGRVTAHRQTTDGASYTTGYLYNLSGAMIEETYPSTRVVKNVLDNDGDLSIVQSKKNGGAGYFNYAKNISYTAAGAVSSMQLGNGKWESAVFNSRLQPTQIALGGVADATNLLKLNFDYGTTNNNGNVLSQTITVPSETRNNTTYAAFTAVQSYGYDALNRLHQADEKPTGYTAAQCGANPAQCWRQTFLYDRYGNRNFDTGTDAAGAKTTTLPLGCATAVCNPAVDPNTNKLIGYGFDNAGNTKTDPSGKQFTYDGENKQTEVVQNSISLGRYFYDGDGKRVKKIALDQTTQQLVTTVFVYDAGGKLVAEYANPITTTTAQVSYLTADHLGSPRISTNENGAVISRHDYQPFGEEVARTSYGADAVRQKFTSYERDTETELDFAQARYYSKNLGRFYSVDPENAGAMYNVPQSWNGYGYAGNNPHLYTDPDGEKWKVCDNQGNCTEISDADAKNTLFNRSGNHSEITRRNGKIFDENGDPAGTYVRTSFDEWSDAQNDLFFGSGRLIESSRIRMPVYEFLANVIALFALPPGAGQVEDYLAGTVARETLATALPQFSATTLKKGVETTLKQKGNHIFRNNIHPKPHINRLAQQLGGEGNFIGRVLQNINGQLPASGKFTVNTVVNGVNLEVRGFVQNGVPIINSVF